MRGATGYRPQPSPCSGISIHAPLAGRDFVAPWTWRAALHFNPRAPCGARPAAVAYVCKYVRFQSTRPLRGATPASVMYDSCMVFQSTRPLRGATPARLLSGRHPQISIHAPLAGRDHSASSSPSSALNFNPRAPCGARLSRPYRSRAILRFQSTRPLRGATKVKLVLYAMPTFQSTRPLRGATARRPGRSCSSRNFNPRAPCGARRGFVALGAFDAAFQSTRPLRGATANLTNFHRQICANDTKKSNLSRIPPPFGWRDTAFFVRHLLFLGCEPAGRGMIASGSHQMISAPSGA